MKVERHGDLFRITYTSDESDKVSLKVASELSLLFMIVNVLIYLSIGFFIFLRHFEILILVAFITKSKTTTGITGVRFEACCWFLKYKTN